MSLACLALSTAFAFVLLLLRDSGRWLATVVIRAFTDLMQNVPEIVYLFVVFFGLSHVGIRLSPFIAAMITVSLYSSAFVAEALRSGLQAVGAEQREAARSQGLSYIRVMRFVVLPQAVVFALPALTNQWVRCVKNTSLISIVGGADLMYQGVNTAYLTFAVVPCFLTIWLLYLMLTLPLSWCLGRVERAIEWRRVAQAPKRSSRWRRQMLSIVPSSSRS